MLKNETWVEWTLKIKENTGFCRLDGTLNRSICLRENCKIKRGCLYGYGYVIYTKCGPLIWMRRRSWRRRHGRDVQFFLFRSHRSWFFSTFSSSKTIVPSTTFPCSRASQYKLVQLKRIYYFLVKDRVFNFCYRYECRVDEPSIRTYIRNLWFWKHVMTRNGDRSWAYPNFLLSKGKNLSRARSNKLRHLPNPISIWTTHHPPCQKGGGDRITMNYKRLNGK